MYSIIFQVYSGTILLTKATAAQNEDALSYYTVRGLYFLAVVFVRRLFHPNILQNSTNDVIGSLQEHFMFYPTQPTKEEIKKKPGFYRDNDFKDLLVFDSSIREEVR